MARVYKKTINIKHYGMFDKIVNISADGMFNVTVPICIVQQDDSEEKEILQTEKIYSYTLKELEEKFNYSLKEFAALHEGFELVICYKWDKNRCYQNGSGFGFLLNWGVFKKLNTNSYSNVKGYFYIRGQENSKYKPSVDSYNERGMRKEGWKEVKWTQEREEFFREIINKLYNTFNSMDEFFGAANMEDFIDDIVNKDIIPKLTTKSNIP